MSPRRRLIVNADDFGYSRDINEGIVEGHRKGIVTAATLMPNGKAFEHAVELALGNPSLDVGCHFVLIGGDAVAPPGRHLPSTWSGFIAALAKGHVRPYDELRAQLRRLMDAGIKPSHLDTHKHTHMLPAVLRALARLAAEHGIRWVRRPFDFPLDGTAGGLSTSKKLVSRSLGFARSHLHGILHRHGCGTTDHFAGLDGGVLSAALENLPPGDTELMCHPGFCGHELLASNSTLKQSRQRELEALLAPEARRLLSQRGIELISYREL